MPSFRLVFSRALAAFSLASRFFCASDFTSFYRRQCLRDWLDTFIRIVLDAVNRAAYGVRLHEACIVGTQHGSCVGVNLLPS